MPSTGKSDYGSGVSQAANARKRRRIVASDKPTNVHDRHVSTTPAFPVQASRQIKTTAAMLQTHRSHLIVPKAVLRTDALPKQTRRVSTAEHTSVQVLSPFAGFVLPLFALYTHCTFCFGRNIPQSTHAYCSTGVCTMRSKLCPRTYVTHKYVRC